MRVKKPVRSKTPARAETPKKTAKPVPAASPAGFTSAFGPAVLVLGLVAVFGVAMMLAAREPADTRVETVTSAPSADEVEAPVEVAKPAAARPAAKKPAKEAVADRAKDPVPDPVKPPDADLEPPVATLSGAVTIAGCLERSDEGFRLKDTSGVDAPKARSWKSGFLKKGSTTIELVDAANGLELGRHAGQRVSVTGALVDREMRVHSLKRTGAPCK